jgi:hypothetical protein
LSGGADDTLRAAFQRLAEAAPGEGVDLDRVWRAVSGEAPSEERREVVARVADDPSWALAWRLAHELWSASREGTAPAVHHRPHGAVARWGTLAAGLVLALGAGLWLRPAPDAGYRAEATAAVRPLVAEEATLPRARFVLRWEGPPGATFDLRVTSDDLGRVHTATGLKTAEYQVPEEFLRPLPAGARLLWQVDARAPGGRAVSGDTFVVKVE